MVRRVKLMASTGSLAMSCLMFDRVDKFDLLSTVFGSGSGGRAFVVSAQYPGSKWLCAGRTTQSLVQILKLNTNENSYPAAEGVAHAIAAEVAKLGRYPDPLANEFRKAASEIHGVPADWILACNGSDDALTIITRATCGDND